MSRWLLLLWCMAWYVPLFGFLLWWHRDLKRRIDRPHEPWPPFRG